MKSIVMTKAALGLVLALLVPTYGARLDHGALTGYFAQDPSPEEYAAYKAYYDANAAKDYAKAMELAKAYVEKFPTGKYADYLKRWIVQTRGGLFNEALKAKNTNEMIRLGKEALAANPEDLDYLYLLAFGIRGNEILAPTPNYSHAAEAADFSRRCIQILEAGKIPAIVDKTKWNQNQYVSLLYQTLALIDDNGSNVDSALENYRKASELDPNTAFNFFKRGSLVYQNKYQTAVQKYFAFPDADRTADAASTKPEVKAALDELNKQADAVIDIWARFMALTAVKNDFGDARNQVEKALTELYKFRHPDSADGLQKLIDQYRSVNPPAAASNTGVAQKP
ncbi:MAG TPA: hypothetical protein VJH03_18605 [Blastocatellia bacterium]|nr:hypothetical protein [Blastocatellia bacterium]